MLDLYIEVLKMRRITQLEEGVITLSERGGHVKESLQVCPACPKNLL